MDNVADMLKMEAVCTYKTLATVSTITKCNNPRTELISVCNHHENLNSEMFSSINVYILQTLLAAICEHRDC